MQVVARQFHSVASWSLPVPDAFAGCRMAPRQSGFFPHAPWQPRCVVAGLSSHSLAWNRSPTRQSCRDNGGCWCTPEPRHGAPLAALADVLDDRERNASGSGGGARPRVGRQHPVSDHWLGSVAFTMATMASLTGSGSRRQAVRIRATSGSSRPSTVPKEVPEAPQPSISSGLSCVVRVLLHPLVLSLAASRPLPSARARRPHRSSMHERNTRARREGGMSVAARSSTAPWCGRSRSPRGRRDRARFASSCPGSGCLSSVPPKDKAPAALSRGLVLGVVRPTQRFPGPCTRRRPRRPRNESGEGGIRTPGDAKRHTGFRNRPVRPLRHLSGRAKV